MSLPLNCASLLVGRGIYTKYLRTRPNHIKTVFNHEVSRRSADIEVSEAIYNCKIGFMEILVFKNSVKYNIYLVF